MESYSNDYTLPCIGIVTGSKLACRKEPNIKSEIINYYEFGTPIKLIEKSNKVVVNNINNFWYKDDKSKGWLFGGYLIITNYNEKEIFIFENERIRCNVGCGGISCFNIFNPYIVGEYYIATHFLNDYPQGNSPQFGIIIGKYSLKDEQIIFEKPIKIAGYDSNAKYIENLNSQNYDIKDYLLKEFHREYSRNSDTEGVFYYDKKIKDNKFRINNRNKCKNKNINEEIWIDVFVLKKLSLKDLQKIFPLIELKNNKYIVK